MSGSISSISGGGGASSSMPDSEYEILCDDNGKFLRRYTRDSAGTLTVVNTLLDGSTVYVPVGTVHVCETHYSLVSECFTATQDETGITVGDQIIRVMVWDVSGTAPALKSTIYRNQTTGAAVANPTLSWLRPCDTEISTITSCYKAITAGVGWSIGDTLIQVRVSDYTILTSGSTSDVYYYNATTGGTVALSATGPLPGVDLILCNGNTDAVDVETFCDDNGAFLRFFIRDEDGLLTINDRKLDGITAYTTVGTVKLCNTNKPCYTCRS